MPVEHALAAHLAGVGGDDRDHLGPLQQVEHLRLPHTGRPEALDGAFDAVEPVRSATAPPLEVVLGEVGDLKEAGEGVHEAQGVGGR